MSMRPYEWSVSVIIAAYDADAWIKACLDSILDQTYPALEVIVVDDGSTDDTARIVKSFDNPVKYLYQEHAGQPSSRNRGIRASAGKFIAFVDADDYWHPRKLELQMKLLRSQGLAWTICDVDWFDSNSGNIVDQPAASLKEGDILEALFLHNFIVSATPVVERNVFEQVGWFNETPEARIGEDWDMWLRIAAQFPVGCVHQKLAHLRLHSGSLLASTSIDERVRGLEGVVERAAARESHRLAPLKGKALGNIYYAAGVQLTRQARYAEAKDYFLRDLRIRPANARSLAYLLLIFAGPAVSALILAANRLIRASANEHRR